MLDLEFVEPEGFLYCRFLDRMDSIRSTEATTMFNDKLAALGHSVVSDDPTATAQTSSSPVSQIVFDLGQVDYVSSAFLRLCMLASRQVKKSSFRIVNTKPQVMKVFKVACLDESFMVS